MDNKQLEDLLILIFKEHKNDKKLQRAYDGFNDIFSPTSYTPIIDYSVADGIVKALKIIKPKLAEEIDYWLWEAPYFYESEKGFCSLKYRNKEYNIFCDVDAIQLMLLMNDNEDFEGPLEKKEEDTISFEEIFST